MIHNPIVMRKEKYVKLYSAILPAGRMRGDVDGDGALTSDDSDCIARYHSNWDGYEWVGSEPAADVNADGNIDNRDVTMLRRIISDDFPDYTPGRAGPEITGNWTNNPNYATDTAQFFTDISVSGVTASDTASITVNGTFDKVERVECLDGAVRVYVSLCPIEDVPCTIQIG